MLTAASSPRRTARNGHRGGAPSSCEQRPVATTNPRSAAARDRSASRALLPTPGSPTTTPTAVRPRAAWSSSPPRAARSRSRPTGARAVPRRRAWGDGGADGAGDGSAGGRHRPGQHGRAQRGVLAQHRLLQRPDGGRGVQPELVGQRGAQRAQRVERLDLAPGAVEGEGVQRPDPFGQRLSGRTTRRPGQGAGVVAEREQRGRAGLQRVRPASGEGGTLHLDDRVVGQVRVGLTRPPRLRGLEAVEQPDDLAAARWGGCGLAPQERGDRLQGAHARVDLGGERVGVDVVDLEPVAPVGGADGRARAVGGPVPAQGGPQAGHVGVQGAVGRPRRSASPDQVGEGVGGQRPGGVEGQRGEHGPGLARPDLAGGRGAVHAGLRDAGRPEHVDAHEHNVGQPAAGRPKVGPRWGQGRRRRLERSGRPASGPSRGDLA